MPKGELPEHLRKHCWTKGESGNPDGKPSSKPFSDEAKKILASMELAGKPMPGGRTVLEMVVITWVTKAIKGDARFLALLLERLEGKVKATIELGSGDEPQVINVTIVDGG
jgi:hypothetical protein